MKCSETSQRVKLSNKKRFYVYATYVQCIIVCRMYSPYAECISDVLLVYRMLGTRSKYVLYVTPMLGMSYTSKSINTHWALDQVFTRPTVGVNSNLILKVEKPGSVCKQEVETLVPPSNG